VDQRGDFTRVRVTEWFVMSSIKDPLPSYMETWELDTVIFPFHFTNANSSTVSHSG